MLTINSKYLQNTSKEQNTSIGVPGINCYIVLAMSVQPKGYRGITIQLENVRVY